MNGFCATNPQTRRSPLFAHPPHQSPGEDGAEEQEGLDLPVNPDQGTPVIPDDGGEITAPT